MLRKFITILAILALTCSLESAKANSICYLPAGAVTIPESTVTISETGENCKSSCNLGGNNLKALQNSVLTTLTNKVAQNDPACPQPGANIPFGDRTGALRAQISSMSPSRWSLDSFLSLEIPTYCSKACESRSSTVTIPERSWYWGGQGQPGVIMICQSGYNSGSNTCSSYEKLAFIENMMTFFTDMCNCFSSGSCAWMNQM